MTAVKDISMVLTILPSSGKTRQPQKKGLKKLYIIQDVKPSFLFVVPSPRLYNHIYYQCEIFVIRLCISFICVVYI